MNRYFIALAVTLAAKVSMLAQHAGHGAAGADAPAVPTAGVLPHVSNGWKPPVEDRMRFNYTVIDRLEFSSGDAPVALTWDAQGWHGGDREKFWWKAEGGRRLSGGSEGEGEVQALYSRLVAPFWDLQAGLRHDRTWGTARNRNRTFAVVGFEGLAPYWFEVEPALFVSADGDVSLRLAATYEVLLTQRLILQPRLDLDAALQDAPEFGIGSGLNSVELGVRLRYEIRREFAPYVGLTWRESFGRTARLARMGGEPTSTLQFVGGLRLWW